MYYKICLTFATVSLEGRSVCGTVNEVLHSKASAESFWQSFWNLQRIILGGISKGTSQISPIYMGLTPPGNQAEKESEWKFLDLIQRRK